MFKISRLVSSINVRYIIELEKLQNISIRANSANKKNFYKSKTINRKRKKNSNDMMGTQLKQSASSSSSTDNPSAPSSPDGLSPVLNDSALRYNFHPNNSSNDDVQQFRGWKDTEFGTIFKQSNELCGKGVNFNLMSYNILAQELLEIHSYLYQNHTPSALGWSYRLLRIKKEVLALHPDILCLQEVQNDHLKEIVDSFESLNYAHVFKRKTGERSDGCAVFYNRNLFSLDERYPIEYFQPNVEYLNRENIAIAVRLSLNSDPNTKLIIATTHLLYNPKRQDVRLAQIQLLLAELDRISMAGYYTNGEQKRFPIILTGDFNLKPRSAPYKLINDGILYYENLTKSRLEYMSDDFTPRTGKAFLPPHLGITDNCQHFDVINSQYETQNSRLQNTELGNYTKLSEIDPLIEELKETQPNLFSSGRLTHNLNLTSVYKHKVNKVKEATTFQNEWITVDYIFYSNFTRPNKNPPCEADLHLLSEYTLPSVEQCHLIRNIPNLVLGSDHLSLAAKFFLEQVSQN